MLLSKLSVLLKYLYIGVCGLLVLRDHVSHGRNDEWNITGAEYYWDDATIYACIAQDDVPPHQTKAALHYMFLTFLKM